MQAHALFQSEVDGGVAELARRQGAAARFTPSPLSSRRSSRPPTAADPAALPAEESQQGEEHRAAAVDGSGPPPATLAQPEAEAERDVLPQIAPEASGSPDTAPRLPRPALDLSLPPDLTDLRRLERN